MWCKARGVRLSGVPFSRIPKDVEKNRARRRQIREDEGVRNAVEGKFGQAGEVPIRTCPGDGKAVRKQPLRGLDHVSRDEPGPAARRSFFAPV